MGTKTGPRKIFFLLVLSCCLTVVSAWGADDATGKKELQRIKREVREKKKELKRVDRKERSILADLESIDRDILAGSAELVLQQEMLRASEEALRDIERNNASINEELASLKLRYSRRIRALYKMNRGGYAAAIFSPDGPGQTLKRVKYLGMIAERDRVLMQEYGNALTRLAARQAEIAEKKSEILAHQQAVAVKKAALEGQRRKKSVILSGVRQKKGLYEQSLRELEQASASLWAMIRKEERESRPSQVISPSPVKATAGRSRLPWPVEGQVLTRFGTQRHPQFGTMVFRRGIEIQAHAGEAVRAVQGGQVKFANWYKGYGQLVIIDHGSGFYSLYGNLSRLDLKEDDPVAGGQVLGLAGETGSMKGSKLYFEIRRNGEAQDPLAWLAKR